MAEQSETVLSRKQKEVARTGGTWLGIGTAVCALALTVAITIPTEVIHPTFKFIIIIFGLFAFGCGILQAVSKLVEAAHMR
jgi:hypothetical protein